MRTRAQIIAAVREGIADLRNEAREALKRAKQMEQGAIETSLDLARENWDQLEHVGFLHYGEAAVMKRSVANRRHRRRTSRRR